MGWVGALAVAGGQPRATIKQKTLNCLQLLHFEPQNTHLPTLIYPPKRQQPSTLSSFYSGANDVANAMGPYSAVYYTWQNSAVPGSKVNVDSWVLAYGGAGIVIGLATYGW